MGLMHSRIIYDPENRNLNLQDLAKEHKTHISEWKIDDKGRMICTEHIDVLPFIDNRFQELYSKLHDMGLMGIHRGIYTGDKEVDKKIGTTYNFKEEW